MVYSLYIIPKYSDKIKGYLLSKIGAFVTVRYVNEIASIIMSIIMNLFIYNYLCNRYEFFSGYHFLVFNIVFTFLCSMVVYILIHETKFNIIRPLITTTLYVDLIIMLLWLSLYNTWVLVFTFIFIIFSIIVTNYYMIMLLDSYSNNIGYNMTNNEQIYEEDEEYGDEEEDFGDDSEAYL